MISGFDRYFQIAPCFRDEDPRADRLPGEFYQLDVEMSFVTQEDVLAAMEPVIRGVFEEFAEGKRGDAGLPAHPLCRRDAEIRLGQAGSAQPARHRRRDRGIRARGRDLQRVQERHQVAGGVVRAIPAPGAAAQPRSFFDKLNEWARAEGAAGLGYVVFEEEGGELTGKGPIAKFIPAEAQAAIARQGGVKAGDAVFFAAGDGGEGGISSPARRGRVIGDELKARPTRTSSPSAGSSTSRCTSGTRTRRRSTSRTTRSRCRTSSRTPSWRSIRRQGPILGLTAFQYDMVCNGYELASGAIRNHRPDVMKKAFGIAGYGESVLEERFGGMYRAFQYGAPPHGGMAAGHRPHRDAARAARSTCARSTLFPMNQKAEDLLLGAPSEVSPKQLRELHIRLNLPQA